MQCKEVEEILGQEGFSPLPGTARAHVLACQSCQNLVADLTSISAAARELPAEVEPPARVWIALRAQLESEGVIKVPGRTESARVSWWHGLLELFRSRALATATVGLLIIVGGILQVQSPVKAPQQSRDGFEEAASALTEQERGLAGMQLAGTSQVDASLRENLNAVDDFIAECERHLRAQPQDEFVREYLTVAYRQKAALLSAMMEREGSSN